MLVPGEPYDRRGDISGSRRGVSVRFRTYSGGNHVGGSGRHLFAEGKGESGQDRKSKMKWDRHRMRSFVRSILNKSLDDCLVAKFVLSGARGGEGGGTVVFGSIEHEHNGKSIKYRWFYMTLLMTSNRILDVFCKSPHRFQRFRVLPKGAEISIGCVCLIFLRTSRCETIFLRGHVQHKPTSPAVQAEFCAFSRILVL